MKRTGAPARWAHVAGLFLVTLLGPGCAVMQQTSYPGEADKSLATSVRVVPINAETLAESIALGGADHDIVLPEALPEWEYTIGPGDVLSIIVWDHPQLTIPAGPQRTPEEAGNRVGPNGRIFYPYIGTLQVAGRTVGQVRAAVTAGLSNVIPNPQVDISVARFGSARAHVAGAVASPGAVPITDVPLMLIDAIGSREGLLPDADLEGIRLRRGDEEFVVDFAAYLEQGDTAHNPQILAGDILVVPLLDDNEVYVLGEVSSPGVVPLGRQQLNLTGALAASDGISKATADASGIFVFRQPDADQTTEARRIDVYQLDATDPTALLLGARFKLTRGDVVYVTSAPATRWNRIIGNLIPSLGALNTLLLIEDRT